ncbi:inositol polyphosphate 5-phosphatase [Porites harrisoni]
MRKEWEIRLQETLGPSHVLMHSCSFGLLHLAVFIRRELVWFCSAVTEGSVSTRFGHMIKTKGALAVSFNIFGTSFLFVNSHFTSDEGKSLDRVNDYKTICKSLSLSPDNTANTSNDQTDLTTNFDRVFWLGDFNFRVTLERSKVDQMLEKYKNQKNPEYKDLLKKDQLLDLMGQGKVFVGFSEPPIRFLPSYKHDIQSDTYDSSSKNRVPSWTDRVLYRSNDESSIEPLMYSSCVSVKTSDHRPVFGIYQVKLNPCSQADR